MVSRRFFADFDFLLFGAALLLALVGILGIYSATTQGGPTHILTRHIAWVGLGVLACFLVASIDYHLLADYALFFYGCSILCMIAILFFGVEVKGTRSWLRLWGVGFQPSELVKIVLILTLARYLGERNENYVTRRDFVMLTAMTLLPTILVILQGDLGTALMYFPVLIGIMVVGGLKMRFLAGVLIVALCVAPTGWLLLEDYQKQRILVTLDPELDPQGYGYQTRQSQIAIGSGGVIGRGLGQGSQARLGFVPEIYTDFIFALLGEETGFIGASFILLLYLLVLMRLMHIAEAARDRTGILITTGVASLLCFHVLVNVGMALGISPAVGIPLPLLSYGGSATLTNFIAFGLVLSIHYRRFVY